MMIKINFIQFQALLLALICCSGFSFLMPFRIYMIVIWGIVALYLNLNRIIKIKNNLVVRFFLLFIVFMIAGLLYSYDKVETIKYIITYLSGAMLILFASDEYFVDQSVYCIERITRFEAFSILIQVFIPNLYRDYLFVLIRGGSTARTSLDHEISQHIYSGILGEKGEAAFVMVLALIILLSKCAYKKQISKADLVWLIIYFAALLLPAKRMLFAVGVMILMLYLVFWQKGSKKVIAFALTGLGSAAAYAVMISVPMFNTLLSRFVTFRDDDSANGRIYLWEHAIQMFREKPIFGYGYGSYNQYASEKGVILTLSRTWTSHAHSIYYQLLGEMGVVGLTVFVCMNVAIIAIFLKLYKKRNILNRHCFTALFIGGNIVVLVLVYGITGNIIYYTNQLFVYIWGISLVLHAYQGYRKNRRAVYEEDRNHDVSFCT